MLFSWRRCGGLSFRSRMDGPTLSDMAYRQHEAIQRGGDLGAVLAAAYRDRGPDGPRLGAATWGTGRGAAPLRFGRG